MTTGTAAYVCVIGGIVRPETGRFTRNQAITAAEKLMGLPWLLVRRNHRPAYCSRCRIQLETTRKPAEAAP